MSGMRTVIRTDQFSNRLPLVEPCAVRADEFLEGSEWVLARDPHQGVQLTPRIWKLDLNPSAGGDLTLYYTFDEENVFLIWID